MTNHEGVPEEFHGAKVIGSWRLAFEDVCMNFSLKYH